MRLLLSNGQQHRMKSSQSNTSLPATTPTPTNESASTSATSSTDSATTIRRSRFTPSSSRACLWSAGPNQQKSSKSSARPTDLPSISDSVSPRRRAPPLQSHYQVLNEEARRECAHSWALMSMDNDSPLDIFMECGSDIDWSRTKKFRWEASECACGDHSDCIISEPSVYCRRGVF